jgi:predicted phosphatase
MKNHKSKLKMKYHKGLTVKRWSKFSFIEQMANIGSEVFRTISWRDKDKKYSQMAFERCLELIDLTVADPKNKKRLKEILRVREALVDYFMFDNIYGSTDKLWQNYFYGFNYAARI